MPQERKTTPTMDAVRSVGPSIKSIGEALGSTKKKKKSMEPVEKEPYSFKKFKDEITGSLRGLKYLNPANRPK